MRVSDLIWVVVAACVLAGISVCWCDTSTMHHARHGFAWLFVVRVMGLCWVMFAIAVLFKVRTIWVPKPAGNPFATLNLVPFKTIVAAITTQHWMQQVVGNMALFVPFPALLWANFPTLKRQTLWWIVIGVTVLVEPMQLMLNVLVHRPFNVVDIDDVFLNVTGCLIGGAMCVVHHRYWHNC